jgi:hypothetical protein
MVFKGLFGDFFWHAKRHCTLCAIAIDAKQSSDARFALPCPYFWIGYAELRCAPVASLRSQ